MNTIEQRKIEAVITADINEKIKEYRSNRSEAYDDLKDKHEKNPPKEVQDLVNERNDLFNKSEAIEKKLTKLGWTLEKGYHDKVYRAEMKTAYVYNKGNSSYTYHTKELLEHEAETNKKIKALERLARNYTLKIYTNSDKMEKLMEQFETEVSKILK